MSVQVIGWALVHSLWQGALIAAGATIALAFARRSSARRRYGICLTALLLIAAAPVVTSAFLSGGNQRRSAEQFVDLAGPGTRLETNSGIPANGGAPSTAQADALSPSPTRSGPRASAPFAPAELLVPARAWLNRFMPWLVGIWFAGVLVLSIRLVGGMRYTRRLVDEATRPGDAWLEAAVRRLAASVGVRRAVRVLETARGHVPLVVGWLRPVLVVPASTLLGLSPAQLELILVHELAHIRRYDFLVNVLQTVIETLLFYHPAVWWLSGRMREEREHCCDDVVLETLGGDGLTYARALLAIEEERNAAVGLAAAATGGSLLRRIRRLVAGEPARLELGSRWTAGIVGVAAVAIAANAMLASVAAPPSTPAGVIPAPKPPVPGGVSQQRPLDSTRAAPASVTRLEGDGGLTQRWRRAEERARQAGFDLAWVGYVVRGDPNGRFWLHVDRRVPVRIGENISMGSLLLDRSDGLSNLSIPGVSLAGVVGDYAPYDIAMVFGISRSGARAQVSRVHVANVAFPMYFDRAPLLWLGEAEDGESLELLRDLAARASKDVAQDLVSAVGAHRSSELAVPVLVSTLHDGSRDERVRAEAAEWLGRHPTPRSLTALARAARTDAPEDVRQESVEALAHLDVPGTLDSLLALTRSLADADLRRTAIEALGHREEPRAFDELLAIVRSVRDLGDQREAVETIAESVDPRRTRVIEELARRDANAEVRREAVESLPETRQGTDVIKVLEEIARTDQDDGVQGKAVESLANLEDAGAVAALVNLVEQAPSEGVRRKAIEALGDSHVHEQAIEALQRLIWRHPDADVQNSAVEAIGNFEDTRVVELLVDVAMRHPRGDAQRKAAETLGGAHPHEAAIDALRRLVWEHAQPKVQIVAAEALGSFDEKRAVDVLVDVARRHPNAEVRKAALEAMQ